MIKSLKNIFENFEDIANNIQTIKIDNNEYIVVKKTTDNTNTLVNAFSADKSKDLYTNNELNSKKAINNDIAPAKTNTTDSKTNDTKKNDTETKPATNNSSKMLWVLFGIGLFILFIVIILFIRYMTTRNDTSSTQSQEMQNTGTQIMPPINTEPHIETQPIQNQQSSENIENNIPKSTYKLPSYKSSNLMNTDTNTNNTNERIETPIESIKTPESLSVSNRTKDLLKSFSRQNNLSPSNTKTEIEAPIDDNKSKSFSSLFSFNKKSDISDTKNTEVVENIDINNMNKDILKKTGGKYKKNNYKNILKKITNNIKPKRTYTRTYKNTRKIK